MTHKVTALIATAVLLVVLTACGSSAQTPVSTGVPGGAASGPGGGQPSGEELPGHSDGTSEPLDPGANPVISVENAARLVEVRRAPQLNPMGLDVIFSPDGRIVYSTLMIWRLDTGAAEFIPLNGAFATALSRDGSAYLIAAPRGVERWNIGETMAQGERVSNLQGINPLALSPDGALLAMGCCEYTFQNESYGLILFDPAARERLAFRNFDNRPTGIEFSPDGALLALAVADRIELLEPDSAEVVRTLESTDSPVVNIAFSVDGARLVSTHTDGVVRVWDVETGEVVQVLEGHTGHVADAALSPDGSLIVSASRDGTARVWDVSSGEVLFTIESEGVTSASRWLTAAGFSPDGTLLAVGGSDGVLRLFAVPAE